MPFVIKIWIIVSRKYSNGKISQPDDVLEAVKNLHNSDNLDLYNMSSYVLKLITPNLNVPLGKHTVSISV